MTILDARASLESFDMSDGEMVALVSPAAHSPTIYSWNSWGGHRIHAYGTGVTVNSSFYPTDGTITSIKIDLKSDGNPATNVLIDASIATAPVSLLDLVSQTTTDRQQAGDRFWEALLSGNDTIRAPDQGRGLLFGDFLQVVSTTAISESKTGGNDVIISAATAGGVLLGGGPRSSANALVGDAWLVEGAVQNNIAYYASLQGGDDRITMSNVPAYALVGDAYLVGEAGEVTGGNDVIGSNAKPATYVGFGSPSILVGDVFSNGGSVTGGNDVVTGANFAFLEEILAGDVMTQTNSTRGGNDVINGRAGHDFIAGDVVLIAGSLTGGDDTVRGGADSDILAGDALQAGAEGPFGSMGTIGPVRAAITGGDDSLRGESGDDLISGDVYTIAAVTADSSIRGGHDLIFGGDGDDSLYGDVAEGDLGFLVAGGNDRLHGEDGDDLLHGQLGNDVLDGGAGTDLMHGGQGNDIYYVDRPADRVFEAAGHGTDIVYSSSGYALQAGQHVETLRTPDLIGLANINLTGNELANRLIGNAGNNRLTGLAGNDRLESFAGNDTLYGGAGDDILVGGAGRDVMRGDAGEDLFDFNLVGDSRVGAGLRDVISDFSQADDDRMDLSGIDASTAAGGNQAFAFIGAAAFGGVAGQLRFATTSTTTIVEADVNGDRAADFQIQLTGAFTLVAQDFIL